MAITKFFNEKMTYKKVHYDKVAMAWQYIFGPHFHFGYFVSPSIPLYEATVALNDALLDLGELDKDSSVLDVGCGIGAPAFYIHDKIGCPVTGISTSYKGVDLANAQSQKKGLADRVHFFVADGTDNHLPAEQFDVVWLMESSHTIKNKNKLFKECLRTLKPEGQLLIADVMSHSRLTPITHLKCFCQWGFRHIIGTIKMRKTFGPGWSESFQYYANILDKIGYKRIEIKEIGGNVWPTFECWEKNMTVYEKEILQFFTRSQLTDFLIATDLLNVWYRNKILSYGLIRAIKPR